MALAIDNDDNAASGAGVSTLNIGTRLNGGGGMTLTAGDILLIHVGTSDPTALRTVSSIIDTASLSWAKRTSNSMTGGQFGSMHVGGELWWAYFGAGGSGYTATIHLSAATDCVSSSIIAVKGFVGTAYHTAPFDVNGALPASAVNTGSAVPGATVTTTAANTMLIGAGAFSANAVGSNGSGYTNTAGGLFVFNGGVSNGIGSMIQQKVVSSTQAGAADDISPTSVNGWVWISDALGQGVPNPHQMPSMGFG